MIEIYREKIFSIPGLIELIKIPVILGMIMDVLPKLLDRFNVCLISSVKKTEIYDLFIQ